MSIKHTYGEIVATYDMETDEYASTLVAVKHPLGPVGFFDIGPTFQAEYGPDGKFTDFAGENLAEAEANLREFVCDQLGGRLTRLED